MIRFRHVVFAFGLALCAAGVSFRQQSVAQEKIAPPAKTPEEAAQGFLADLTRPMKDSPSPDNSHVSRANFQRLGRDMNFVLGEVLNVSEILGFPDKANVTPQWRTQPRPSANPASVIVDAAPKSAPALPVVCVREDGG